MRKSFFSGSIYTTWLKRYWLGGALMTLVFVISAVAYSSNLKRNLFGTLAAGDFGQYASFINNDGLGSFLLVFVVACAIVASMLCMHYLQDGKSAVMVHSLPITRQAVLVSVVGAGLSLLLVPILLAGMMFGVAMGIHHVFYWTPVLVFVVYMSAVAIMFFLTTTFVGLFTGKSLAQGIITIIFVNLPLIIEGIVVTYGSRYLFGFPSQEPVTAPLNMFYQIAKQYDALSGDITVGNPVNLVPSLAFVLVGVLFLAGALLLYKIRKVEAAGDIITFGLVKPVFLYLMAFIGAFVISQIFTAMIGMRNSKVLELIFGIVGGLLGYFVAQMFLNRSVRVLRFYKGAGVFTGILIVLMLAVQFDIIGYGNYKLPESRVQYISITNGYYSQDRVVAAMKGKGLSQYVGLEDLPIKDVNGYLEKYMAGDTSDMPDEIAKQILQLDPDILRGDNVTKGVAFQHLLAQNAKELQNSVGTSMDWYENVQIFYINALLENGQVVTRRYTFVTQEGDGGVGTEISQAWTEIQRQQELARVANMKQVTKDAVSASIDYHFRTELSDRYPHYSLNRGDWDGLLEAYEKDVQKEDWSGDSIDYYESILLEVGFELPSGQLLRLPISTQNRNAIEWFIENDLLSPGEVKQFEKWMQDSQNDTVVKENYAAQVY